MSNSSFQKAEKFFEVPVMVSVLMLIPVLVIEYTQQTLEPVALYLNWGIWAVFLVEYVVLFYLSENKIDCRSHQISQNRVNHCYFLISNCSRGVGVFWIFKIC